jgi:nucleotide-binding universal stress UspA family protein
MIRTVLVPVDGSPEAAQAVPFAQAILSTGGQVILLHVVQDDDLLPKFLGLLKADPDEEGESSVARSLLDQVVADAGDPRLDWQTEVVRGEPATEILRAVTRAQVDAIVLTTHGRGAVGRAVFGNVADRIARTAPVPVLLVRPHPQEPRPRAAAIRRLVVPLDGSPLAEQALPVATDLAQRLKTPVHLVQVINLAALLAPMTGLAGPGWSPEVYDDVVETARREASGYLEEVGCRLTTEVTATWAVLEGSPFISITEAAKPDDLVVMTSHGRGGTLRWLLGSVAEKLVREAPCPVLLVPAPRRGDANPASS